MNRTKLLISAATLGMVFASPAMAQSTNVAFSLKNAGATVAGGSFSYLDTQSGVLNYTDLTAFSFNDGASTFDLASVLSNGNGDFNYLGYSTLSQSFVARSSGGFTFYITSVGDNGFYTDDGSAGGKNPGNRFIYDYASNSSKSYDAISVTSSASTAVPEPATWAMMLVGFGMVGFGLRASRKGKVTTKVAYA